MNSHVFWYVARGSGLVAWVLLERVGRPGLVHRDAA